MPAISRAGRKPSRSLAPDINVTPLVDVVLVLLIIFMVIAPQMEAGLPVDLPKLRNTDRRPKAVDPTTVSLTADGAFHFDQETRATPASALHQRFQQLSSRRDKPRVLLRADRSVPYGKVRTVLAAAQAAGLPGMALQVEQPKQESR